VASWLKCTTTDGIDVELNFDQVAVIRPHRGARGAEGSEVIFAGAAPSSIVVKGDPKYLIR
jgi:hypothetical protein